MDQILQLLRNSGDRLADDGRVRGRVVLLVLVGIGLAVGGYFVPFDIVVVLMGSLAGVCWFSAGYLSWYSLLGEPRRSQLDIRARWYPQRRRRVTFAVLLVWLILMIACANLVSASGSAFGAANVAVMLTAWLALSLTPEERAAQLAEMEAQDEADLWAAENPVAAPETVAEPPARGLRRFLKR